jgi:uncharacterized protein YyaL (SSP411 family)
MPGWYDARLETWLEDEYQVSTHAGNVAWAMLALLAYHDQVGGTQYLRAAERLGEWVEENCRDGRGPGGYTAGFQGWEPTPDRLTYKSTEHNLDLAVAFERLFLITGDGRWHERSEHAKRFVRAMWDPVEGKFWTGTTEDGVTVNRAVVPLDAQAWAVQALRDEAGSYRPALRYAEEHHRVPGGFDFNEDLDGVWYEGTAQMAVAYHVLGERAKAEQLVRLLKDAQLESGALHAADRDGLTTGFELASGQPWLYYRRAHVGATAWLVLAEIGVNPFWFPGP